MIAKLMFKAKSRFKWIQRGLVLAAAVAAFGITRAQTEPAIVRGGLTFEVYFDIPGNSVFSLLDDFRYPDEPDLVAYEGTTTVEPIRTPVSRFNDFGDYVRTFYYRTHFNFSGEVTPSIKLQLRHVVDDGAVFHLNGVEIQRFGISADAITGPWTDVAAATSPYSTAIAGGARFFRLRQ